ncbi:MAG: DUF2142 domain-containing protein [Candidatus Promineifilaceae bacterium]|nr:DUF2142 domain-containing protein [Candidatus Promineifilaceae bacterium]
MSDAETGRSLATKYEPKRIRIGLLLLLAANFLVTAAYGFINPLFEAPDEQFHYYTVQLIADSRRLPFVPVGVIEDEWISQEAAQPPLYYLIGAGLISAIDSSNAREKIWPNKYPAMGEAGELNNRNIFIHTPSEAWPWHGFALAVHLLRLFSTLLATGTLLCIYSSGRLLWPHDPYRALLAMGLMAFLPQFNFLFASVSNDTLIIFLTSAAIWQLIRAWQGPITRGRHLLLGITIGLAMLSKNAGLILLIYAAGFMVLRSLRDVWQSEHRGNIAGGRSEQQSRDRAFWHQFSQIILFVILPPLLIAGWVYVRNHLLYGDLTATNQFLRFSSGDRQATVLQVVRESGGLWLSLIAVFGWFNIRPPEWVYWFWNGVVLLSVGGAAWSFVRRQKPRPENESNHTQVLPRRERFSLIMEKSWFLSLLLCGWVVLIYASLFLFMLRTEAAQGRLLFPALVPMALGLAYGWSAISPMRRLSLAVMPLALGITVYCLFLVIRPTYALPQQLIELPHEAQEIEVEMGQGLTLLGSKLETQEARAGDPLRMVLYWRADSVPEMPVEHVLSVFGREHTEIGKLHSYHGRGLYPANLWPADAIIADRFAIYLDQNLSAPVLAAIESGLTGEDFSVKVGEVKIVPEEWPEPMQQELARLGDIIALTNVLINPERVYAGDVIDVHVKWQVLAAPERDFTTLVHLGQPDQPPLAVGDRPPLNGAYPTRAWEFGEVIEDVYSLALPTDLASGRYPLWLGMYDPQSIERLPVTVGGEAQTNNVILAGWLEIE